ncbi:MAG: hypothetical protein WD273_15255 [Trueperaceae bacterium]
MRHWSSLSAGHNSGSFAISDEIANIVMHVNWNPSEEWAEELLYVGWD